MVHVLLAAVRRNAQLDIEEGRQMREGDSEVVAQVTMIIEPFNGLAGDGKV